MTITQLRKICKPFNISVENRWGSTFQVSALSTAVIEDALKPLGFTVKAIGIGFSYWKHGTTLFIEEGKNEFTQR